MCVHAIALIHLYSLSLPLSLSLSLKAFFIHYTAAYAAPTQPVSRCGQWVRHGNGTERYPPPGMCSKCRANGMSILQ